MTRANYIGAPQLYNLNTACRIITEAYGYHLYLVGSSLTTRDYRDVDLRLILPDPEFDRLLPGIAACCHLDARWSLLCSAISLLLSRLSDLPVDFQIQRASEANAIEDKTSRQAIGIFFEPNVP